MEINALAKGVGIFGSALTALKDAIDLLPDSSKKAEASEALENATRAFKTAEVESAKKLGYQICLVHFPPGIMLLQDNMHWKCPQCGNKVDVVDTYGGAIK